MSIEAVPRVVAAPPAVELIEKMKSARNGGMFSLERTTGLRFLTRSRLFDDTESAWLAEHPVEHTGT